MLRISSREIFKARKVYLSRVASLSTSPTKIETQNDTKDLVILHQFPRGLRAPSASPFPIKLETWSKSCFNISFNQTYLYYWIFF